MTDAMNSVTKMFSITIPAINSFEMTFFHFMEF